jgi:hypothetical protein
MAHSFPDGVLYYIQHGPITAPGRYAALLDSLPTGIEDLVAVVRGLLFHYSEGEMYGYYVPDARVREDAARTVPEMLDKILALDDGPLRVVRPFERRLVGCCRDYAVLLTALLRQQGVPARTRYGFSRYFRPDFAPDHVVCEVWHEDRWRLVDAQQDTLHCQMNHLAFDPLDIPPDQFPVAGQVWHEARTGRIDPVRYGYDPDASGMWVIQSYLVHDLAALNKRELLIGDTWGLAERGPDTSPAPTEDRLLDEVATLTPAYTMKTAELRACYAAHLGLQVPPIINHWSLLGEYQPGITLDYIPARA